MTGAKTIFSGRDVLASIMRGLVVDLMSDGDCGVVLTDAPFSSQGYTPRMAREKILRARGRGAEFWLCTEMDGARGVAQAKSIGIPADHVLSGGAAKNIMAGGNIVASGGVKTDF